jgi:hypothetical protein
VPPDFWSDPGDDEHPAGRLIPGAYERNTVTQRQPGAMGGAPFGTDGIPAGLSTMSAATIAEREKEGGGGISQASATS